MVNDIHRVRDYLWRRKLVLEATFAINALEPWEKIIYFAFLSLFAFLLFRGASRIFPAQLFVLQRRGSYYLWGHESDESFLTRSAFPPPANDV